jgi:hypothetical protein
MANKPKSPGESNRARKIEMINPTDCPAIFPIKSQPKALKVCFFKSVRVS